MKVMSRTRMSMVCLAAIAACTSQDDARKVDPNIPAVVQAPPIILPSDTAKPDTMPAYQARMKSARIELLPEYGFITAGAAFGDYGMLASIYSPDATLSVGDSTYVGGTRIAAALVDFFRRYSVSDLTRQPGTVNAVDSVYTDSGRYEIVSKRGIQPAVTERGGYVAKWRLLPRDPRWSLLSDEFTPDSPAKKP